MIGKESEIRQVFGDEAGNPADRPCGGKSDKRSCGKFVLADNDEAFS